MSPDRRRRFVRAAVALGVGAVVGTVAIFATGFTTSAPSWLVTLVGVLVAFAAIGAVLCLFLTLFDPTVL